jgi:hypothetical protein
MPCQQPIAVQHFKSDTESAMSVTAQMANSEITLFGGSPPTELFAFGPWFSCQVGYDPTCSIMADSFIRSFAFDP